MSRDKNCLADKLDTQIPNTTIKPPPPITSGRKPSSCLIVAKHAVTREWRAIYAVAARMCALHKLASRPLTRDRGSLSLSGCDRGGSSFRSLTIVPFLLDTRLWRVFGGVGFLGPSEF